MKSKTQNRPRLYIFKSNKHIYANLINDKENRIITSSSTLSKDVKSKTTHYRNCKTAAIVGKNIGLKLSKLGIKKIIFDRGSNLYHGQIQALAEATRKEGIIF